MSRLFLHHRTRRFGKEDVQPKCECPVKSSYVKHKLEGLGIRFEFNPSEHCISLYWDKSQVWCAFHLLLWPYQTEQLLHHIFQPGHKSVRSSKGLKEDSYRFNFDKIPNPTKPNSICWEHSSKKTWKKIMMDYFKLEL